MTKFSLVFAERIVSMAEQQASHRRDIESKFAEAQTKDISAARLERRRGQNYAIVAVLATLAVATVIATIGGNPWAATGLGCAELAGLVVAFVAGRPKMEDSKTSSQNSSHSDQD